MAYTDETWKKRHEIIYRIQLSSLYHRKRERFFDFADKITKAISLALGTAAISSLLDADKKALMGALIAGASMLSLVFGFAEKARKHAELAKSYLDMESEIIGAGTLDDFAILDKFESRVMAIEAMEPPTLRTLARICQNEINLAIGRPDEVENIPFYQKFFAHF
ncbi:MAG: hypothetical protein K2P57_10200 [Burkholderiales bacterium]|nr:hypothetical protein [Burkholderiales bacterium]